MGNEADKKFTWVIKNFSSLGFKSVSSDIFVVGRCKWRLRAFPMGVDNLASYLSLYLAVHNHESLPSGWRRHAKFSITIVYQIPGAVSQLRETQNWFDQKNIIRGFPYMIRLSDLNARDSGLLVNDELKIVAEIDVLEVVGELDAPVVITDIVESTSENDILECPTRGLTKILCKSSDELSDSDLAEAYSALRFGIEAGFKLDWLEKALKEACEIRIQEIEEKLSDLTEKRADMYALLKSLK
ncbi:hypothetical protein Bca52824_012724 [Brassica carinata]|uniref:MATH domain-containing protein n=1 Tax=Brassica carinata TaxID=52824 RepID=A0A8X7VY07_BRACI|nr:hypothetical protein Bca52824_012724 [Brassica carinata]